MFNRGLTSLLHNDLSWLDVPGHIKFIHGERYGIAARRRKLRCTWSTFARQKSSSIDNAQPCSRQHLTVRRYRLDTFRPAPVLFRKTHYRTVRFLDPTVSFDSFRKRIKWYCLRVNILSPVECLIILRYVNSRLILTFSMILSSLYVNPAN